MARILATRVCGDRPPDRSFDRGIGDLVELAWEMAAVARVFLRLASFRRLSRSTTEAWASGIL